MGRIFIYSLIPVGGMMKKLKEMAAISLFTLLAAGFSASAMADGQKPGGVPAAKVKPVGEHVHWCTLFDPDGMELPPLPGRRWPYCS
ncbi:hypothetical protein ACQYBH_002545 [Salmonella enterica]|uniref:Uncharacterized protein n=1 Tax=Salmonella enterica TaxID=28901 RepID=A0A749SV35_SALER|nr:hypothetical protein [Salmonella enterica]EBQ2214036.1 hypothetical protein [Salmonella enterica subsp. enterica]ECC0291556.1 hypothetical protein [Salmonella enterica subsp. enterica serovar Amsterdam var. 15+,34+]ECC7615563.1 hypothetical protein [Salmonella enterica subsp. enterica serovar Amsterdam]EDH8282368.1 hypothetical protein [Salmonella enterica subsp. enterica serovar Livingstone]EDS3304644.1 hypothetical protein [Salmonella enterica subsp. enterica serovar Umbadah]EDU1086438.1